MNIELPHPDHETVARAEDAMVMAAMHDPACHSKLAPKISEADFSDRTLGEIWTCLGEQIARGVIPDATSVASALNGRADHELIQELFKNAGTSANAEHFAKIIKTAAEYRRACAREEDARGEIYLMLSRASERISQDDAPMESVAELIHGAAAALEAFITGVPADWPDPQPIPSGLLPVPAFSFDLLPESLRPFVQDITERMQCPPEFPAVAIMVALSIVIGRKAVIRPKRHDDWEVTPNLWGMSVAPPGAMKSPAHKAALKPLDRLEAASRKQYRENEAAHERAAKLREMTRKDAETKAAKAIKEGDTDTAKKLLELADQDEQANDAPMPALKRYKVTDTTVEALGEILMEPVNQSGILAYADELHGLLCRMNREGQEGGREFYLQGYEGDHGFTFDRIGRGKNLHIDSVCIAMFGGIQPAKLASYIRAATSHSGADDGLLQRFGMLVWPDTAATWKNVDRKPDIAAEQTAFEVFDRLDALTPGTDENGRLAPLVYRFTDTAQQQFDQWRAEHEIMLRSGDYHPALESHFSKYRKLIPALALLSALADDTKVNEKAITRALKWRELLEYHARRAYGSGQGLDFHPAKAVLKKIRAGKVNDPFSARDIYLKGWADLSDPAVVSSACDILADLNHLKRIESRSPNGGRASVSYRINPKTRQG